jgi:hypothetical protein
MKKTPKISIARTIEEFVSAITVDRVCHRMHDELDYEQATLKGELCIARAEILEILENGSFQWIPSQTGLNSTHLVPVGISV